MVKRRSILAMAAILTITLAFAGCFTGCTARKPITTPYQSGQNTGYYDTNYGTRNNVGNYGGLNNYGGVGRQESYGMTDYRNTGGSNNSANYRIPGLGTPTTAADSIAKAVETVPGVQNATVVVSGNTAYVGIDTTATRTGTTGTANLTDLKKKVAQTCRNTDDNVLTVYVSADANFMDRLKKVGNGIRAGKPIQSFTTELTEMVRRLTPEKQ